MLDVAKKAGVSLKTVSRVVNEEASVSEKTRTRVLEVIRELKFVPNLAAATLVRRKAMAIGLVLGWPLKSTFSAALTDSAFSSCQKRDYGLVLFSRNTHIRRDIEKAITGKHIDGLILDSPSSMDRELVSLIESLGIPYVIVHPIELPHADVSFVDIDDYGGAKLAISYLIELGHRHIGLILEESKRFRKHKRYAGYLDALTEHGIPVREEYQFFVGNAVNSGFQNGHAGARELMEKHPELTAIFCETDETAMGAMSAVWQAGKSIPEDISIIGFDDIRYAEMVNPPLTTIRQPVDAISEAAVAAVIGMIKDPEREPVQEVLSTELVVRNSTRPLFA